MVKAQVLVGGRGKAGGVKLAATPDEAAARARDDPGHGHQGHHGANRAGRAGGRHREGVLPRPHPRPRRARRSRSSPARRAASRSRRPPGRTRTRSSACRSIRCSASRTTTCAATSFFLGLPAELRKDFATVLRGLYAAFVGADADLAEINPLVVTDDGRLLALDAKIVLDDSALFRHPDLEAMRDLDEEEPAEIAAREAGISFIKLDGSIGCMVNGAGLAMTTMDLVKLAGGEPANFLDIGGGAKADKVAAAFRIILADPNVRAILINIFGGITRGDEVARGIVEARASIEREVPMVVRIVGTNAEEARPILRRGEPRSPPDSLDDAAAKAVAAADGARRHEHPRRTPTRGCWCRASPGARASSTRARCWTTARTSWPA